MPEVDMTNLNAYYSTTTPGMTIQSGPIDPALQSLVVAINDNYALFQNLILAVELPILDQSIVTRHLRNLAVTNPKLAPLAVTADKIADGSITLTKLADLVVTAAKIAEQSVTETKLGTSSVSTRSLAPQSVTASKLDPSLIDPISDAGIQYKFGLIDEQLADFATQASLSLLQLAIDNTPVNGVLRLSQGTTYTISSPLTISKRIIIEGNGANIVASSAMSQMIFISQPGDISDVKGGVIRDLTVDCNNLAQTGVNVSTTAKFNLDNVYILNSTIRGIWAQNNHEGSYTNLRITSCPVGITASGSDQHFTDIFMRYCHIAIQNNSYNIYTRVHAWVKEDFAGSTFAEITVACVFNECYPDTYNYGYRIKAFVSVSINGGHAFWNAEYWTGSAVTGLTPYYLYYDNMAHSASTRVSQVYISPGAGITFSVSNAANQYDFKGIVSDSNLFFNYATNFYSGKRYFANFSTGVTVALNKIVVKNNRVVVELKVQPPSALGASSYILGTLPSSVVPENEKIFTVPYASDPYQLEGVTYGYISTSGTIRLNSAANNLTTVKWFNVNIEYDIGFENHA